MGADLLRFRVAYPTIDCYFFCMLYRASVQDVKTGRVARRYGYLAVVMQFYPRFLSKELVHEYLHELAPERALFLEFKALAREKGDHNAAFAEVGYEDRFGLSPEGWTALERLSGQAKEGNVFLICQCSPLDRCHADLLLLLARHRFAARTSHPRLAYPCFEARLPDLASS